MRTLLCAAALVVWFSGGTVFSAEEAASAEQVWNGAMEKLRAVSTFTGTGLVSQNRPGLGKFVWRFRNAPDGFREDRKAYASAFGNRSPDKRTIHIENRQGRWEITEFGDVFKLDFETEYEGEEVFEERLALGLDHPHTYSFRPPVTIGDTECLVIERRRSLEVYRRALAALRDRVGLSDENRSVLHGGNLEDKISVCKVVFVSKQDSVFFGELLENKAGKIIGGHKCEHVELNQPLQDADFAVPTNPPARVATSMAQYQALSKDGFDRHVTRYVSTRAQPRRVLWVIAAFVVSSVLVTWTMYRTVKA